MVLTRRVGGNASWTEGDGEGDGEACELTAASGAWRLQLTGSPTPRDLLTLHILFLKGSKLRERMS